MKNKYSISHESFQIGLPSYSNSFSASDGPKLRFSRHNVTSNVQIGR